MRLNIFVCALLLPFFIQNVSAQNLLINNSEGEVLAFDADGCTTTVNANIYSYTDIAQHPNGLLYGVTADGQLYEIDTDNGTENLVHDFSGASDYYALTADADGNVFAASGSGVLASFNPSNNTEETYPNMGFSASGDLTFYEGQMYMATYDNTIVSVHPNDPQSNEVFIDFSSSGATIFGIVSSVEGCVVETYAFSNGDPAQVYQIDWEEQSFDFVCTIPHRVYGGSSEFEFDASGSLVDILEINLSDEGCGDLDVDVEVVAQSENGGIVYSLDNESFQTDNVFLDLEPGNYTVYLEDEAGCTGNENFLVFTPFIEVTSTEVVNASCGNSNGSISVVGNSGTGGIAYALNGGNYVQGGTFTGLAPGDYEVTIFDLVECETSLTLTVEEADLVSLIDLEITDTSCGEDNGRLVVGGTFGNGNLTYSLNEGAAQAEPIFTDLAAGDYALSITDTDNCGLSLDFTIVASENIEPEQPTVTEASCAQANGLAVFVGFPNTQYSLDGQNFTEQTVFNNLKSGEYTAYYQFAVGCIKTIDFTIPESEISCGLYIPSAFSPNFDGINDVFKPYSESEIIISKMQIFDRWGGLIYSENDLSTTSLAEGWNGEVDGKEMPEGVYVYVISYLKGEEKVQASGDFALLR